MSRSDNKSKYKKVGVLPIWIVGALPNEGQTLETLDYTIRIGSTPTFLYFDLYLYSAYAAHYVYYFNSIAFLGLNPCNSVVIERSEVCWQELRKMFSECAVNIYIRFSGIYFLAFLVPFSVSYHL